MRVVSYNVRYFAHGLKGLASTRQGIAQIARVLAAQSPLPDVLCLQEVESRSLRSHSALDVREQAPQWMLFSEALNAAVAPHAHYVAHYFPAHVYGAGVVKVYTTGLLVLLNARTAQLRQDAPRAHPVTEYDTRLLKFSKQTRICTHVPVEDLHHRPLHIFNTHLSLPTPFAQQYWKQKRKMGFGRNQLAEAHRVLGFIEAQTRGEPLLLCGDFNAPPGSPTYAAFAAALEPGLERFGLARPTEPDAFATAGFLRHRMHLDHLFGRGVRWNNLDGTQPFGDPSSPFQGLSDHTPLLVNLDP